MKKFFKNIITLALILSSIFITKPVSAEPTHVWEYSSTRYYNVLEVCTSHKSCYISKDIKEDTYWCIKCDLTYLQLYTQSLRHITME